MMRPFPVVVLALALLGCSAGQNPPASAPPERSVTSISTLGGTTDIVRYTDSRGSYHRIPAAPDRAWSAVMQAYADVGIQVATFDRATGVLGNRRLIANRRLGNQALSRFFNCGSVATGTPVADAYRMQLSVVSHLSAQGEGESRLETRAEATAFPHGTSSTPVQCSTTGALERRIAARVGEILGS